MKRIIIFLLLTTTWTVYGNNLRITNAFLTDQNTTDKYTIIEFDIAWDNSWRISQSPSNWDAVWVFFKYRVPIGSQGNENIWKHATLNTSEHQILTGFTIDTSSDGKGVFIYRSTNISHLC